MQILFLILFDIGIKLQKDAQFPMQYQGNELMVIEPCQEPPDISPKLEASASQGYPLQEEAYTALS